MLELKSNINNKARTEMNKEQREYLLRQQLRAIQQELGEKNPEQAETDMLREQLVEGRAAGRGSQRKSSANWHGLRRFRGASPEHNVIRTYLELVLEFPWNKAPTTISTSHMPGRCSMRITSD